MDTRFSDTQRAVKNNNPSIEVNQIWFARNSEGTVLRRIRILALHPDPEGRTGKKWIYCNEPGGLLRLGTHELGICPEFNIRYVMELEK